MMRGLLVDCQSRHWKLICSQMQKFPRAHIDPSQDIIKKIIDKHILFTDIPPHDKGQMWAVEYLQRIKAQLQNMAFGSRGNICSRLRKTMHQPVTMLSELVTAGVAILTFVSLRERAWSLCYGEGETDLAIGYCEIQSSLSKTVKFPSFELQQGLFSLFSSAQQEIAYGRPIDSITLLRMARRVFSEGGLMYRYDMLATPQGTLRPDLAPARKQ